MRGLLPASGSKRARVISRGGDDATAVRGLEGRQDREFATVTRMAASGHAVDKS
jgi:hypothetical protein